VLDQVSSINDLEVIIDEKITFSEHVYVMVTNAFAMLGFIPRLSLESLYSEVSLQVSGSSKAGIRKLRVDDVRVDRVERVQRRSIRYALRGLGWMDMIASSAS
jgi:hypothetical protein